MKHFITGGAGFFGHHIIEKLLAEGHEVIVYDTVELEKGMESRKGVTFIKGDVLDLPHMTETMKGVDVLHHYAALVPIAKIGRKFWDVNVGGTRNALLAAQANNVPKVVTISTSSVYGHTEVPVTEATPLSPIGDYGWSKFEAEAVCREFRQKGLDITIIRPRTIVGPGRLGIFSILFEWIQHGKRIYIIGKGDNLYQFVSPRDVADACFLAATKPCKNEDFIIGAEVYATVKEDLDALVRHAGTKSKVQPINAFIARNSLRLLDFLHLSPLADWHYKTPHLPFYFDVSKAKRVLGWRSQDSNVKLLIEAYDWYVREGSKPTEGGSAHRKPSKQGILKLIGWLS